MTDHMRYRTPALMEEINEPKCVFDRLPPEMNRFIFRKLSTEDLLVASATTDRLYRVAQHHMYLSESALLVRGGQDTAATVTGAFDIKNVASLYLIDVFDFGRDVPRELYHRDSEIADDIGSGNENDRKGDGVVGDKCDEEESDGEENTAENGDWVKNSDGEEDVVEDDDGKEETDDNLKSTSLDVLHVGYAKDVRYDELPADGVRRLLSGVRAKRVYFSNVLVTVDDVADVVSTLLESGGDNGDERPPPVLGFSYDRADDADMLSLLDMVERTCAGLLAEFRITVRRPAPHAYAIYPMSRSADYEFDVNDDDDDDESGSNPTVSEATVAMELPEDLLALTASDCSGFRPPAYKRLASSGLRIRRLCMKAARQADDDGFKAVTSMPALQHLDMDGMSNVTSDGLMKGLEKANTLQSLGLSECPYVTDDVLRRVGELRRLRRLRLDLTECDKTTAAGVLDMLSGCERLHELYLTLPLSIDYLDAVAQAASLERLQLFWLTFERLSFQDHLDSQPTGEEWCRTLAAQFRDDVDFRVGQTFTKITVTAD